MSVLTACRPRWCDQLAAGGVPDLDQLADLVPLLAVTLRWITAADAVEVLSERVASARDLPSLLRWRLQGTLRDHRRRRTLAVDEDGAQYRARARARAAAAAERHASTAALRRAVRERLDEVRRVRAARASTRAARPPLVPSAPTAVEPGETFQPPAVEPGAHDDQMLRDAVAAHRRGGQPAPVRDVLAHLPRRADA